MKEIKKISVISETKSKNQTLRDRLTTQEIKVLKIMLNSNMNKGRVRNKFFIIEKIGNKTAKVEIGTESKSIILGTKEIIKQRVKIKYE